MMYCMPAIQLSTPEAMLVTQCLLGRICDSQGSAELRKAKLLLRLLCEIQYQVTSKRVCMHSGEAGAALYIHAQVKLVPPALPAQPVATVQPLVLGWLERNFWIVIQLINTSCYDKDAAMENMRSGSLKIIIVAGLLKVCEGSGEGAQYDSWQHKHNTD